MNSKMNCAATVLMLALGAATAQSADQDWEVRDVSARYVAPPIEFAPCAQNASAECGELIVPIDYNNPHEGAFGMAVVRARATDPSRRIGVLMANPGGPGDSGIGLALGGLQVPSVIRLRERFDIISFDVRGSHRSRPVRCEMQPASVPERASRAELTQFFDELSRRIAQACVDQNGRFVTSVSTNNIARDMDVLRRALAARVRTPLSAGTEQHRDFTTL